MPHLRQREATSVALQPICKSWPLLRGPWSLWDVKKEQLSHRTLGCCLRKPWQHYRHSHPVSSPWMGLSKSNPCKIQSWRTKPAMWKGSCGTDWHHLQSWPAFHSPHTNLSLTVSPHPPGTSLMQGARHTAPQPSAQNSSATPNPARAPAAGTCSGLTFAGCRWEYL